MLLFTNCEVDTAKYLDRSFDVWTEWNEVRTKNKVRIFSVWNEQLINKSFIL